MKVIVIYGSPNDKPFMEPAREYFAQENVPYEETVLSAHRDLPELIRFLGDLEASPLNGIDALLAIAQCPGGVPCTTVGLHKKTPVNAAMAAHRILKLAGL